MKNYSKNSFIWLASDSYPRMGPKLIRGWRYSVRLFKKNAVNEWVKTGVAKWAKFGEGKKFIVLHKTNRVEIIYRSFLRKLLLEDHGLYKRQILTDREDEIIRLRIGYDNDKQKTLKEVGDQFKVSRERIRQIEAKALRKMESYSKGGHLRSFLSESSPRIP